MSGLFETQRHLRCVPGAHLSRAGISFSSSSPANTRVVKASPLEQWLDFVGMLKALPPPCSPDINPYLEWDPISRTYKEQTRTLIQKHYLLWFSHNMEAFNLLSWHAFLLSFCYQFHFLVFFVLSCPVFWRSMQNIDKETLKFFGHFTSDFLINFQLWRKLWALYTFSLTSWPELSTKMANACSAEQDRTGKTWRPAFLSLEERTWCQFQKGLILIILITN